jgi:hypothetical protein
MSMEVKVSTRNIHREYEWSSALTREPCMDEDLLNVTKRSKVFQSIEAGMKKRGPTNF